MQELIALGWDPSLSIHVSENRQPARVAIAERGRFYLLGPKEPVWAGCAGRLLNQVVDVRDLPTVGDWVAVEQGVIKSVLPRSSCFARKAAGRASEPQLICANVTTVFVVTAVGIDLNERRLERYVAAVVSAGARPVIVINKSDLADDAAALLAGVANLGGRVDIVLASAHDGSGIESLEPYLGPGETIALVGSSGVGKSSLVNRLMGEVHIATGPLSETDGKGQHTTTRRELVTMPGGALLIDTPGMREFGLWEAESGLDTAFADVELRAADCHFRDCGHTDEPGCAVLAAVAAGELDAARVDSFHRLQRENAYQARRAGQGPTAQKSKDKWKKMTKGMRERKKLDRKLGLKGW